MKGFQKLDDANPFGGGFHRPFKGGYVGTSRSEASYRYTHQDESVHAYMYVFTKLTSLVRSPDIANEHISFPNLHPRKITYRYLRSAEFKGLTLFKPPFWGIYLNFQLDRKTTTFGPANSLLFKAQDARVQGGHHWSVVGQNASGGSNVCVSVAKRCTSSSGMFTYTWISLIFSR